MEVKSSRRPYLYTYAGALLSLVVNIASYWLSARIFSTQGFAEYATGRRFLSLGLSAITPALGVSITYHVASSLRDVQENTRDYFLAGHAFSLALILPMAAIGLAWPRFVAEKLFGNSVYTGLLAPLSLCLLAFTLMFIGASYLVGNLDFGWGSLVGCVGGSILPTAMLLSGGKDVGDVFWRIGVALLVFSSLLNAVIYRWRTSRQSSSLQNKRDHFRRLASYAAPRLPAAGGLAFLMALPVLLTADKADSLVAAGVLSLGGILLTLVESLVNPVSAVLLPQAARSIALGGREAVLKQVKTLWIALTVLVVPIILIGLLVVKPVLTLWVSPEAAQFSHILQWMLPTLLPYAYYRAFSAILDASSRTAFNSQNVVIALVVYGGCYALTRHLDWTFQVLMSFLLAVCTLGVLTVARTLYVLRDPLGTEDLEAIAR